MGKGKLPIAVVVVACLYIAVGAIGLVFHFPRHMVFHQEDFWIELTEILAVIAGAFLLLAKNWARWLAIAWMAFHVALVWPAAVPMAIHTVFLAVIAWSLFNMDARLFFRGSGTAAGSAS